MDESLIGCQNEGSIDDCKTREYNDVLMSQCNCLPFNMGHSDQVGSFHNVPRA